METLRSLKAKNSQNKLLRVRKLKLGQNLDDSLYELMGVQIEE